MRSKKKLRRKKSLDISTRRDQKIRRFNNISRSISTWGMFKNLRSVSK